MSRSQSGQRDWPLVISESIDDYSRAYKLHTQAYGLIMDCARLHQGPHIHLRRVSFEIGNYGERITDWFLRLFAPLGVFELISYFPKTDIFGSEFCKRGA